MAERWVGDIGFATCARDLIFEVIVHVRIVLDVVVLRHCGFLSCRLVLLELLGDEGVGDDPDPDLELLGFRSKATQRSFHFDERRAEASTKRA